MWMQYIYPHCSKTCDSHEIGEQTDLNWRFMSTGNQYVYCIVEKQTGYSPFVLQNKLLVFDLWSGTRCYYSSSTSPDLAEFYETGENSGIAVMDDGSDISNSFGNGNEMKLIESEQKPIFEFNGLKLPNA
ncbi:hypothetical protein ANCCAN_01061 [Ancylostoma caninum]|uniref:Uncharacterized protein n=1 Tax=Ancylostoma caninum TaxID=29170 RepID=A0A368HBR6_ANCCA|nr:hypothetical protein ANCCAN_01061 [Ancylostoma caninum]